MSICANKHIVLFLSGLTGSGKTYIYEIIKAKFAGMFTFTRYEHARAKTATFNLSMFVTEIIKVPGCHFIVIENPYDLKYESNASFIPGCDTSHLFLDVSYIDWSFNIHFNEHYKIGRFKLWFKLNDKEVEQFCAETKFNALKKYQREISSATIDTTVPSTEEAIKQIEILIVKNKQGQIKQFQTDLLNKYPEQPKIFSYQGFNFGEGLSEKGGSQTDVKWGLLRLNKLDFKDKTVLDVGSNIGTFSYKTFRGGAKRILGIEMNPGYHETSLFLKETFYANAPVEYIRDRFLEHSFNGETFDYVLAIAVLHHMANFDSLDAVIKKLSGVCKHMAVIEVADKVDDPRMTQDYIYSCLKKNFKYVYWTGNSIGYKFNASSNRHIFHCYNMGD